MENGRQPYNLWITVLLSGDISAMIFKDTNLTIRGAVTKTDLSLVDKIELGRTYEEVTGGHFVNLEYFNCQTMFAFPGTLFGNLPNMLTPCGAHLKQSKVTCSYY